MVNNTHSSRAGGKRRRQLLRRVDRKFQTVRRPNCRSVQQMKQPTSEPANLTKLENCMPRLLFHLWFRIGWIFWSHSCHTDITFEISDLIWCHGCQIHWCAHWFQSYHQSCHVMSCHEFLCSWVRPRQKVRLYNQNHAVRRSDVINEDTENWGEKKDEKIRGKGGSRSCRWFCWKNTIQDGLTPGGSREYTSSWPKCILF